jgi:hypothetical protein
MPVIHLNYLRELAPLLAFAALFIILLYVAAPMAIKAKNWMSANPEFLSFDLSELPPEIAGAFQAAARQLAAMGFTAVGHVTRRDPQLNSQSHVSVWSHAQHRNICQVIAVRTRVIVSTLVTFRQEYRDDESIITSNTKSSGVFPKDPKQDTVTCSGVDDLVLLYRLHRARVVELSQQRTPQMPAGGQAHQYMAAEWKRTFTRLCNAGYYRLTDDGQRYVKTVKGAYIMTWRMLWPLKQLRLWARDRRAERELRRHGLPALAECRCGGTTAPPAHADSASYRS